MVTPFLVIAKKGVLQTENQTVPQVILPPITINLLRRRRVNILYYLRFLLALPPQKASKAKNGK